MKIPTSRFGEIQVSSEDEIHFKEGLLGFGDLRRFILLEDPNDEIFAWLQSCEQPNVAFPVLEPELFAPNYLAKLTRHDMESVGLSAGEKIRYFCIITIPEDLTLMTANMKAPIVVNVKARTARQCVLQENDVAIKEPIFSKLQQRLVMNPARSIQERAAEWGVPVHLSDSPTASLD